MLHEAKKAALNNHTLSYGISEYKNIYLYKKCRFRKKAKELVNSQNRPLIFTQRLREENNYRRGYLSIVTKITCGLIITTMNTSLTAVAYTTGN